MQLDVASIRDFSELPEASCGDPFMKTMKKPRWLFLGVGLSLAGCATTGLPPGGGTSPQQVESGLAGQFGPAAALQFARQYRGEAHVPGEQQCYPDARGIPFSDTEHVVPMTESLWTPAQLRADFERRMAAVPANERKKGIIVLLKTERCATKAFRACTTTTAALEKRATPLAAEFVIYGVWLLPRDGDKPPGSLKIETGAEAWKNDAAGEYQFLQGPGATLAFIHPVDGTIIDRTDAMRLSRWDAEFQKNGGRAPKLHAKLQEILRKLG